MKRKDIITISAAILLIFLAGTLLFLREVPSKDKEPNGSPIVFYSENDKFRNQAVEFLKEAGSNYFEDKETENPKSLSIEGNFSPSITIYHNGKIIGKGAANRNSLALALKEALQNAIRNPIEIDLHELTKEKIENSEILVSFSYNNRLISFVSSGSEGKEIVGGLTTVRHITKADIKEKIQKTKEFLLRMENNKTHGFYKRYDALIDGFTNRVHTVYSASIVYTLLKIYDFDKDPRILEKLPDWGGFLLSMQNEKGAFHYSYFFNSDEKQEKYVSGTTALTIFTLIELYEKTKDNKYLEAVKLGGDWLLSMQGSDGKVQSYKRFENGEWKNSTQFSVLYNGQTLSALSRLYRETKDTKYLYGAEKIANVFVEKSRTEGCYIGDDYREPNPISSAWIVMSLLDYYRVTESPFVKVILMECSKQLLEKQQTDQNNLLYFGRWERAYSTSGNGWLAEVLSEVYKFCKEEGEENCEIYKEPILRVVRWLFQNTYTKANSYILPNPERAEGGMFWNSGNRYVRTDSNCHGGNPYVNMFPFFDNGILLSVPEEEFEFIK